MNYRLTILFFFFTPLIFGQSNLVPNPSFEDYSSCPDMDMQVYKAVGWHSYGASPEYYNSCALYAGVSVPSNDFGYQTAYDGNAYCGFYTYTDGLPPSSTNFREYIGRNLFSPLVIGQKYYVSIRINLADGFGINCATNNIGVLFSTKQYLYDTSLFTNLSLLHNFSQINSSQVITDITNWSTISGSFISDSSYQYIIIGNFYDDLHTDTIVLNNTFSNHNSYYFIDEVCVSTDSLTCNTPTGINENYFSGDFINIFPTPATNELTIDLTLTDKCTFELYDLLRAKRLSVRLDSSSKTVDLTGVDSGVYVFTIVDSKGDIIKTDKLIIIK